MAAPTSASCPPARWSGTIDELPTVAELIGRIVEEADTVLRRLQGPG